MNPLSKTKGWEVKMVEYKTRKEKSQMLPIGERYGDDETHVRYHPINGEWVSTASVEGDNKITFYTLYRTDKNVYQVYSQCNSTLKGQNKISYTVSGPLSKEEVIKKYPMLKVN